MQIMIVDDDGSLLEAVDVPPPDELSAKQEQDALGHEVTAMALRAIANELNRVTAEMSWEDDDLYTIRDIATMCGVEYQTVHRWKQRDRPSTATLPQPTTVIADRPLWKAEEIIEWAVKTGRFVRDPRAPQPEEDTE